jgi:hypothetical protein
MRVAIWHVCGYLWLHLFGQLRKRSSQLIAISVGHSVVCSFPDRCQDISIMGIFTQQNGRMVGTLDDGHALII